MSNETQTSPTEVAMVTNMNPTTHIFQEAGLGTAPFKVVGFEVMKYQACQGAPIQPGTSCDYCGTAIMNVYWILGSAQTDQLFKVGCVCVEKTGDRGLINRVQRMEQDRKRNARKEAEANRIGRLFGLLSLNAVRDDMASRPHPMDFRAEKGDTELNWADWMVRNSGNAGKIKVAKHVESVAKDIGVDLKTVEPKTRAEYIDFQKPQEAAQKPEAPAEPETPEPIEAPVSAHVGTVGKRIEVAVKVQFITEWDGNFGPTYLINMTDSDGNILVYKGSSLPLGEEWEATIRATVKDHGSYKGTKQTVLGRIQVRCLKDGDYEIRRAGRIFKVFKDGEPATDKSFDYMSGASDWIRWRN